MKTCGHIRPVLLTDYIDGEIDQDTRKSVEEHLTGCADCKRLVAMVREGLSILSSEAAKKKVPSHIWPSIIEKITREKKTGNAAIDFVRTLVERLTPPRLVPALVGITLLVLSASFFLYTQYLKGGYGNGSVEYISGLFANGGSQVTTEQNGLGTPIEEYFL